MGKSSTTIPGTVSFITRIRMTLRPALDSSGPWRRSWLCEQATAFITRETSMAAMDRTRDTRHRKLDFIDRRAQGDDRRLAQAFQSGLVPVTGNALAGLTQVGQSPRGGSEPSRSLKQAVQFWIPIRLHTNDVLDVNYVGSRGRRITHAGGMNYDQLSPNYLSMGSDAEQRLRPPTPTPRP